MKKIQLSKGYEALVDDKDYGAVSQFKWSAKVELRRDGTVRTVYADRKLPKGSSPTRELMHRFILGLTDPKIEGDHRDGDGLNNQRYNLRPVTSLQNSQNIRRVRLNNTSGVPGVCWDKEAQKWSTQIRLKGKTVLFGRFSTLEEAKAARAAALKGDDGIF